MPSVSFTGIASGIDGDSIIKALADSRRLATVPLKNNIESNDAETTALQEVNTKLLALKSALNGFTSFSGGALSRNTSSSNPDVVTASATESARSFSTKLQVFSLANTATLSFDDRFTTLDTPLAPNLSQVETVQIDIGRGQSAESFQVKIDANTTLQSLAEAISKASGGKVEGSVVNAGTPSDPQYLFLMQGTESGLEAGELSVSVPPGVSSQGLFTSFTLEQAQDAVFSVTGIGTISRGSNQVSDLFPGVSFELKQSGTGSTLINVGVDEEKTAEKLNQVVDAFNDLVKYSNENSTVERVEENDSVTNVFSSLAGTRIDEQVLSAIRTAISGARSGDKNSKVQIFADLGVTTQRDGTLKFDAEKFKGAVSSQPESAAEILSQFADNVASAGGIVANYTRFSGVLDRAERANEEENKRMRETIARIERSITAQTDAMKQVFASLEGNVGRLQSDGQALTNILAGLK